MENRSILSLSYWREATKQLRSTRMIVFAALIVALRVAVKAIKAPVVEGVEFSFDCYVNSLGSLVYGPVVGLLVGAVSDTLGCILFPSGAYFFPFIFVEMSSSFLFALFFWRRQVTVGRTLTAKFSVNMICNIILTSLIMKWDYAFFGLEKSYPFITLVRIVKNLALFPFEAVLILVIMKALVFPLRRLGVLPAEQEEIRFEKKHILPIILLFLLSVGIILLYMFFLKDFVKQHNFSWL